MDWRRVGDDVAVADQAFIVYDAKKAFLHIVGAIVNGKNGKEPFSLVVDGCVSGGV